MVRPRIIPTLLVHNGGLVKTTRFGDPKYVGDPINAVRIFNEKEVDELVVLDIDATIQNREPNFGLISKLAAECRMPLCYGGGIKTTEHFETAVSLGVEKVAISSAAVETPELISEAAARVGGQSVVVVVDVAASRRKGRYEVVTHNSDRRSGLDPIALTKRAAALGAGEIVVNSVDHNSTMSGYDLGLASQIRAAMGLPLTVLGGAGSLEDISQLIRSIGIVGAAAGSLFVFKGKYRAVLINYPGPAEKEALCASAGSHLRI